MHIDEVTTISMKHSLFSNKTQLVLSNKEIVYRLKDSKCKKLSSCSEVLKMFVSGVD